jgi:hypothetical protein
MKLTEIVKKDILKEAPAGNALWQRVSKEKTVAFVSLGKVNVSITVEAGPLHKQRGKYAYRIRWEVYGTPATRDQPLVFSDDLYNSEDEALKAGLKHYKKMKSKFRMST